MKAAHKTIKFLYHVKRRSMRLDPGDMQVTCGFDSDFATERFKRRSRGGYWIKIGNAMAAWKSKLQSVTATSPAEAEYVTLQYTIKDAKYIIMCLEEFGYYQIKKPHGGYITIEGDNSAVECFAKTTSSDTGIRHLDVSFYFDYTL